MDTTTILAGGRLLTVTFMDGTTKEVKVRQLPIRLLGLFDAKQADEAALVELYCNEEKGWADTLTHESYEAVATLGDEINRGPFERYTARMVARVGIVKGARQTYVDAGVLSAPPQRPRAGELLIMPEVTPAAPPPNPEPVSNTPSPVSSPAEPSATPTP